MMNVLNLCFLGPGKKSGKNNRKNGKVREFLKRKKVGTLLLWILNLLSFLIYNSAAHLLTDLNTNLLYWVSHRISVE